MDDELLLDAFAGCDDALLFDDSDLVLDELSRDDGSACAFATLASVFQSNTAVCSPVPSPSRVSSAKPRARRRVQLRPNVEIAQLRAQAANLEAHVAQLRKFYRPATGSAVGVGTKRLRTSACQSIRSVGTTVETSTRPPQAAVSPLFQAAVDAYASLRRAQQRNKQLRDAVDEQLQAITALQQLLQFKLSTEVHRAVLLWSCVNRDAC